MQLEPSFKSVGVHALHLYAVFIPFDMIYKVATIYVCTMDIAHPSP